LLHCTTVLRRKVTPLNAPARDWFTASAIVQNSETVANGDGEVVNRRIVNRPFGRPDGNHKQRGMFGRCGNAPQSGAVLG
jgi:hypothetical protein